MDSMRKSISMNEFKKEIKFTTSRRSVDNIFCLSKFPSMRIINCFVVAPNVYTIPVGFDSIQKQEKYVFVAGS